MGNFFSEMVKDSQGGGFFRKVQANVFLSLFKGRRQSMLLALQGLLESVVQEITNKNFCLHRILYNG